MQDFGTLHQLLLGVLAMSQEEERKRKMPLIVATYISDCSPREAHTLRSDQQDSTVKHELGIDRPQLSVSKMINFYRVK